MKLLKCIECEKEISISAGTCPNCGSKKPFKNIVIPKKEQKGLGYKERKSFLKSGGKLKSSSFEKIIMVIIIGLVAFFIFKPDTPLTPEQQAVKKLEKLKSNAEYQCYQRIIRSLHVPDSYERVGSSVWQNENDSNLYGVMISYKAKNKFGVLLSSNMTCVVKNNNGSFAVTAMEKTK